MTRDSVIIVSLFVSAYLLDYKLYVVQDEINVWLILDLNDSTAPPEMN